MGNATSYDNDDDDDNLYTGTKQKLPVTVTTCTPAAHSSRGDENPNVIHIEDIPHSVIARGIAARTNSGTLFPFHQALQTAATLRLHRPGLESCKISTLQSGWR